MNAWTGDGFSTPPKADTESDLMGGQPSAGRGGGYEYPARNPRIGAAPPSTRGSPFREGRSVSRSSKRVGDFHRTLNGPEDKGLEGTWPKKACARTGADADRGSEPCDRYGSDVMAVFGSAPNAEEVPEESCVGFGQVDLADMMTLIGILGRYSGLLRLLRGRHRALPAVASRSIVQLLE